MEKIKYLLLEKKRYIIGIILLLGIITTITFIMLGSKDSVKANELEENVIEEQEEVVEEKEEEKCLVKVDIKGQVNNPGLYEVECSERVNDVVTLAGGLTQTADTSTINLSKKVFDQMVIIVSAKQEEKKMETTSVKNDACVCDSKAKEEKKEEMKTEVVEETKDNYVCTTTCVNNMDETDVNTSTEVSDNKISLNSATKEELMTLTGVGEAKALNIIKYREEHNGFKEIEEIMNISGIGEKAFEKIKDSIKL